MKLKLHQTHHTLCDFDSIFDYLKKIKLYEGPILHLFPELFLTGYPLQDICLQKSFYESYQKFLKEISEWSKTVQSKNCFLMGGLDYEIDQSGVPKKIKNVIYELQLGGELKKIYTKQLLPNYDIFDEKKYFTAGQENVVYEWDGCKIGLLICEDMWTSTIHDLDPCQKLFDANLSVDLIINLSASPFNIGKNAKRLVRATEISRTFGVPFIYVNRVGAEDEILFDGASFIMDGDKLIHQLNTFREATVDYDFKPNPKPRSQLKINVENTWENLFNPQLEKTSPLPTIQKWSENDCREVLSGLKFGLSEYARKTGFSKFLVAVSGGIDSALVLAIAKLALKPKQTIEAIYMPSQYSASLSFDLSQELCKNLGIPFHSLPIVNYHSTIRKHFMDLFHESLEGLANENVQSRLRGMLLYTRSNQTNSLVINTSNKSELAVGYSTQYGDSVGALSLLGDLYKTEVYWLSEYINKTYNNAIPKGILSRAPSAELRENQTDNQSLPDYDRLDAILEGILSYRLSMNDLLGFGFKSEEVRKVLELHSRSEYKRMQFCPIIKVKSKSFGFGHRIPITKNDQFYYK